MSSKKFGGTKQEQQDDPAMLAALSKTKEKGASRGNRKSALQLAGERIAADPNHPMQKEVKKFLDKHIRVRGPNLASESAEDTDAAVAQSAARAAGVMRNQTAKERQTATQKAQITTEHTKHKQFYDSDDDSGPKRVKECVVRDSNGKVGGPKVRSLWFICEEKDPATGEWEEENDTECRPLRYVMPRIEEVESYGHSVAEWFGKNEADRTGKLGVMRPPMHERGSEFDASLKKARATHEEARRIGLITP